MISDLMPYPAMKDSGAPWLGEVPEHWEIKPNRALFKELKDSNHPDEPLLSVTIAKGVIRQSDLLSDTSKKDASNLDKSKYKLVLPGEIAYNKMRAWQGAIGVSRYSGIISPAYVVQRPRAEVMPEYMHYLLRTPGFAKEAERWSYGITSDMWSLRPEHFKMIYVCIPPLSEQSAIVRFLDHVDGRIRRYIRTKQKLIKLLVEQKQVIIHHAVTRGLDPNVLLKPSGVEWLGDVPEHWEVVTLRRVISRAIDGPHYSPVYLDNGIPFLSARNIKVDRWSLDDVKFISEADYLEFSKRVIPKAGDVLYTKGGTTGVARVVDLPFQFQVWVHVAVLKVKRPMIIPEFLAMSLNSPRCYEQAQLLTRGATNQDLGLNRMKNIFLALPPLADQEDILNYIGEATRANNAAIDRALSKISLIREYRTRLISDVVTGKLDVRGIELPAADAEAPEECSDLSDFEAALEDQEMEEEIPAEGD